MSLADNFADNLADNLASSLSPLPFEPDMGDGLNAIVEGEVTAYEWYHAGKNVTLIGSSASRLVGQRRGIALGYHPHGQLPSYGPIPGRFGGRDVLTCTQSGGAFRGLTTEIMPAPFLGPSDGFYIAWYGSSLLATSITGYLVWLGEGGSGRGGLRTLTTQRLNALAVVTTGSINANGATNSITQNVEMFCEALLSPTQLRVFKNRVEVSSTSNTNALAGTGVNRFRLGQSMAAGSDNATASTLIGRGVPSDATRDLIRDYMVAEFS